MSVSKKEFRISTIFSGALMSAWPSAPVLGAVGAGIDGIFLSGSFGEAAKTFMSVGFCAIGGGAAGGALVSYDNPSGTLSRIAYGGFAGAAIGFAVANIDNLPENSSIGDVMPQAQIKLVNH